MAYVRRPRLTQAVLRLLIVFVVGRSGGALVVLPGPRQRLHTHGSCLGRRAVFASSLVRNCQMTSEQELDSARAVIREAVSTLSPSGEDVLGALGTIDDAGQFDAVDMEKLKGRWRLVASSGNPKEGIPRGYFPRWLAGLQVFEQGSTGLTMSNVVSVPPLELSFTGPCTQGAGQVEFNFDTVRVRVGPVCLLKKVLKQPSAAPAPAGAGEELSSEGGGPAQPEGGSGGGAGAAPTGPLPLPPGVLRFMLLKDDLYAWKGANGYGLYRRARRRGQRLANLLGGGGDGADG